MNSSARGPAAPAVLLAAALGLCLTGPHRAGAAPQTPVAQNDSGVAVTILSPVPRASFNGTRPVEISAFYQGSASNQIVNVELYVDGNKAAQKVLDAPELHGVVSFLIDASALSAGQHRIVVRATAADAEIASAHSSFVYDAPVAETPQLAPAAPQSVPMGGTSAPSLSIMPPSGAEDDQVQGTVKLRVQASDPSGKPPFVSIFIDRQFKTLRNYAPYEFEWDTTTAANGYHTIEAFGYNDAQAVGHAPSLRLYVNNPGGRTERRTDLLDAPARMTRRVLKPAAATHRKATAIARRPSAPLLAFSRTASAGASRMPGRLRIAEVFALMAHNPRLSEMPALPAPFVGDAVLPAPPVKAKAVLTAVHPATPTHRFKPLTRSLSMDAGEALMAFTPTARPTQLGSTRLLRLSKTALPGTDLSTEFMLSPTLPKMKATVAAHTTLAASPARTLRIFSHAPQVTHPVKTTLGASVQGVKIHMPRMASQLAWMRAVGQKTLLFNSSRLPLERPLAAQGSVMFGPLRQIFEQGGGSLLWEARTGAVRAHSKDHDAVMSIGQKSATVDNAVVILDGKPYLNNGRTMIPLSFLQKAMNVDVQYDETSGHLLITSRK